MAKLSNSTKIQRNNRIIFKDVEGVVYLLDQQTQTLHTLNNTASFVWRETKSPRSIDSLIKLLCQTYEVKPAVAKKDISFFVKDYLEQGFFRAIAY